MTRELRRGVMIDELPESYLRWRTSQLGQVTDALERDLILDLCGVLAGRRMLDVGCGDADLVARLGREGAEVTGLDSDPRMLAASRGRLALDRVGADLVEGEIGALPFADGVFDLVTAVAVLCLVRDAEGAVAEMARVLKPGGRLVIGELGRHSLWAAARRVRGWLGSPTWRAARFWSEADLRRLARAADLSVTQMRAAVFYPPVAGVASMMRRIDPWLGRRTTFGGAFIAFSAVKR